MREAVHLEHVVGCVERRDHAMDRVAHAHS